MRKSLLFLLPLALLSLVAARRRAVDHPGNPTFNNEIVRILQQNCQSCHRPGDIAPFALMTYRDAASMATQIKIMTSTHRMPPWKAAEGCGDFLGVRRLTQYQIDLITRWVDAGAPEGRKEDLPPEPPPQSDWVIGAPDIVLTMPKPFTPPADREEYRCFSIPVPDAINDLWVSALDFRPGDRGTVHHIVPYVDATGASVTLDPLGNGFTCFGGPLVDDAEILGAWSPGARPTPLQDGTAVRIPGGSRVLLQIHYSPHFGKVGVDQTQVGLYLAKSEVRKELRYEAVLNEHMVVPAGAANHRVDAMEQIDSDVELVSVYPHMHLLGQKMKVEAILPDGTTRCLCDVPHYEFQWQGNFVFREPVRLPRGTKLHVEAYYDNSTSNFLNPNSPPKEVRWGEKSTDEMCIALFGYTVGSN